MLIDFMLLLIVNNYLVPSAKYLGLHIDKNLSWHKQFFKKYYPGCTVFIVCVLCLMIFLAGYTVLLFHHCQTIVTVWTPSTFLSLQCLEQNHSRFSTRLISNTGAFVFLYHMPVLVNRNLQKLSPPYLPVADTLHYAVMCWPESPSYVYLCTD